jgi:hypothetical protein
MEVKLSSRNPIVIPREARHALRINKLLVVVSGGRVLLLEKPRSRHAAVRGLAHR